MKNLGRLLAGTSAATVFLIAGAPAALAQAAGGTPTTRQGDPAAAPQNQGSVDAEGTPTAREQDIVVTGSRIRLPNLQSVEPTVTVSKQYIEERGITNVADALNELPGFRGSVTPNGSQGSFGQGVNFVNLWGLGSNRTLTLVNGRRFVTSNTPSLFGQASAGTQVDLNVIPTILVDHIDTISIGGAPVYGSDAIAGAVNIVLRDRYKGLTVNATSGITERGDNFRYNLSALGGVNFAGGKGNLTLSYSRDHVEGLLYNDRDFLRANLGNVTNPCTLPPVNGVYDPSCPAGNYYGNLGRPGNGISTANDGRVNTSFGYNNSASDNIPGTILARDVSIYYLNPFGVITSATGNSGAVLNYAFDANGNLQPYQKGIIFPSIYASGGQGFRFNDYSQITSDLGRNTLNGFAHYDVSNAFKLFAEGEYFTSRADELVQQPTFNSNLFGGTSGALTFTPDNPFLTAQARTQLQSLGITKFQVSRANNDLADLTGYSTTKLYRAVIGAKGDYKVFGHDWNYEVTGNYGRTDINDHGQDINRQNFINAVNVTTNAQGQIVCTATPTVQAAPGGTPVVDPNCVPLNLLGTSRVTDAARNYVIQQTNALSRLQEWVFDANTGGSLFSIFGNATGFNVGYEHRVEKGAFVPDPFQQQGLGRSAAVSPVSGSYTLDEAFGETILRIVGANNHVPFIHSLELFGRGRYVHNSVNGGFFSWAAGGEFEPIAGVRFRGNYTKSFRSPAVTELYLPISPGFATVPDLCSPANINAGSAPANRKANCTAFLAKYPNATPLAAAAATVPSLSGGNPTLQNEVASSFSYGVILQPHFMRGFAMSVDYLDINITNPIANLTIAQIASGCFDNSSFNTSDPANGNAFCSKIKRDANGQVINDPASPGVSSGYVNGNRYYFSGIQGELNYDTRLTRLGIPGRLQAEVNALYVRRRLNDITGVAPTRTDGTFFDPKFSFQATGRYIGQGWGFSTSVNFQGETSATRNALSLDLREFNTMKAFATVNASIYVDVQKKFRWTLSVTNVGDYIGQHYYGVIAPYSYYDLLGRRFTTSVRVNF